MLPRFNRTEDKTKGGKNPQGGGTLCYTGCNKLLLCALERLLLKWMQQVISFETERKPRVGHPPIPTQFPTGFLAHIFVEVTAKGAQHAKR